MGGIAALTLAAVAAQTPDSFEAAAIRPNLSGDMNTQISMPDGGRLVVVNATLKTLIRNAYGLLAFQLAGGPRWLDDDKYNIDAKTGSPEKITQESLQPLLRSLLADRFRLVVHWEPREEPIYALLTDKAGIKFQPHRSAPGQGMNMHRGPGKVSLRGVDVPLSELASNLGNQLGRFAIDRTGLNGRYDFVLEWDPDQTGDSPGPSLFTAVREQLGLRLEPGKGQVQVLVIDRAEKPTEN